MMSISAPWFDLLTAPSPGQHIAQLYTQREFLSRAIATFVGVGLRRGDAAVVISTPLHWRASLERLRADGVNVQDFQRRRQLLVRDARTTLATCMVDGAPDRDRFRATIDGAIDETRAAGFTRVRMFGEMVDILRRTDVAATMRLEQLWNELLRDRQVALLCGYSLDAFDPHIYHGLLQQVSATHSDLIPVDDYARLARAVDRAYADVFGGGEDAKALQHAFLTHYRRAATMPEAEAAILALREFIPDTTDALLERARRHYAIGDGRRSHAA
jgi:MEDS: MEthanogen/methylotroph, DcmR Sensory domain